MPVSDLTRALDLKNACDEAYLKFPTSCSHAVMYVLNKLVSRGLPHRDANGLIDFFARPESKWVEVSDEKPAQDLADTGVVVVAGLKKAGHGHVVVIYPGGMLEAGGYDYYYRHDKKVLKLSKGGKHARCMSTSITSTKTMEEGFWPGTMSKGDKTVWDPWANDETFKTVKFYAEPGTTKS